MKKKLFSALKFSIFLGIGIFMLWLAFRGQDLGKMWDEIRNASFFWIILSCLIGLFSHYLRAIRWNLLIEPLGSKPKAYNTFFAVMVGYLANLAFPRMGEISRCALLNKYEKVPLNSLLGTILVERGIDLATLLLLVILTVALQMDILRSFFWNDIIVPVKGLVQSKFAGSTAALAIIAGAGAVLLIIFFILLGRIKKTKFYQRVLELLRGLWEGVRTVRSMKNKRLFFVYTFLIWFCYWLMTYVCFFSIPSTSHLGLLAGLSAMTIGGLGVAAPVQGGIGAYHWVISQTLILYGVAKEEGLVWATIIHTTQMIMLLVVGFISLLLIPYFSKK